MWSWLLKLIQFFRDEEEVQEKGYAPVPPSGQLQAKTKNIYPREREHVSEPRRTREKQRHFRFPVIPDQPVHKTEYKETAAGGPSRAARVERHAVDVEKRPYKPTEVISPVYGRIPPETYKEPARTRKPPAEPVHAQKVEAEETIPLFPIRRQEPLLMQEQAALKDESAAVRQVEVMSASEEERTETPASAESQPERPADERRHDGGEEREEETRSRVEHADTTVPAEEQEEETWPRVEHADTTVPAEEQEEETRPRVEHADTTVPAEEQEEETRPRVEQADTTVPAEEREKETWPRVEHADMAASAEELGLVSPAEEQPPLAMPPAEIQEAVSAPLSAPQAEWRSAAPPAEEKLRDGEGEGGYLFPPLSLLNPSPVPTQDDDEHTQIQKLLLEDTLANFNVSAQVVGIVKGPSVTRFELQPAPGVKVNKITGLIDDIKLNLAAKDIRIEAPIPGRNAVGIEVPNLKSEPIFISRIIGSDAFRQHPSPLAVALGMDIGGAPIIADIKKMPHGLIAGATGSGKSVCINSIIVSLLYKASPEQVRLLLIDPKMVELAPYNHLPHLVTPVVTDAKQATAALKWAVEEMERRYALFADAGARDIERYNQTTDEPLPYIVIIIDELADLMMVSPQDVEESIIRIAQKARACGIHLLLATQRPSVDVITGNIKANVPTRLAFAVFSQVDSRTILDMSGAERLLGRGDMLFLESGAAPVRLQGNYVSDDEIERVTQMIKRQRKPAYLFSKEELEQSVQAYDMGDDPLYHEALLYVAEQGQASASALQRRFRIGYNRAARLIEMMEAEGHVAGQSGGKPRTVLITREDAQALMEGSSLV
ncbi:DNA translocase FtsK [Brevibacillus sp. SYP-B805]|uniref:DNA translocase FtsK n=1 Tax=Brevibacillus sp. SYP-B805 TaxID=1578199 RepID=UPI0013EC6911|nr:DNA translocase FtsK [Brevibacillus sp. SYP-B805]NGQ96817.1 DNA translocase FtsK [Brevibacillus sp. SYP-B805]